MFNLGYNSPLIIHIDAGSHVFMEERMAAKIRTVAVIWFQLAIINATAEASFEEKSLVQVKCPGEACIGLVCFSCCTDIGAQVKPWPREFLPALSIAVIPRIEK